ncbi:MAG: MarR family transcriptional regulator [Pyrinomonadaceae bacterium]
MGDFKNDIKSDFINERVKANLNILYTANYIYNKISANLKPFDLTHEQFNVLRILRGKHPEFMNQKAILERMIAPNSNLTLIIKKLVDKNLVKVNQSAIDKRAYEINITEDGMVKLEELDQFIKAQKGNFSPLSESEAFHLNALLDKIRE